MQGLEEYKRKRNFKRTPEPTGSAGSTALDRESGGQFVIHKHAARNLHYDLRLEQDGVFKSWAVPKGPSLEPGEKRLAVRVEDHPMEYGEFEGVIPKGEYGGGTVMLWDRGFWLPLPPKNKRKSKSKSKNKASETADRIDFILEGEKLHGAWTLVRSSGRSKDGDNWLLIKRHDTAEGLSHITELSVATGRTMNQIAADRNRTWTREGETSAQDLQLPDPASLKGARPSALGKKPEAALATLAREAPVGDRWLHEIKFDGYRILARLEAGKVQLFSRNGKDWTKRFREIASLLRSLDCDNALIDGEVVALAADGISSFRALQEALSEGKTHKLVYQAFDLIHLDGYDLGALPLTERKTLLEKLLLASGFSGSGTVRYTSHIQGRGPEFLEQACMLGLEGIISKRADSRYRPGRGRHWLKAKCTAREELVICGFTEPAGSRSGFGALLLAGWRKNKLVYAGRVGTGFSDRQLKDLHNRLRKQEVKSSPLSNPPAEKSLHWVKPELVAQVEFTEWTRDGLLRHPVFLGLREDKDAKEVALPDAGSAAMATPKPRPAAHEKKAPGKKRVSGTGARGVEGGAKGGRGSSVQVAGVTLSNADRVLYPELGITKLALAEFYAGIEEWLLPHLALRPLSLLRCPSGHTEECFFQKHPRQTVSKSVPRVLIPEKGKNANYLYVKSIADVIALVQIGALELHVWGSRVEDVERPDILVFDLDPSPEVAYSELLRVARELRDRLAQLGLNSFPRTTGGKGLHLVVPVIAERGWEEVKGFCQAVARQHARDDRQRVTANMAKSKRQGRVFMDYLRNGRGATAIASYSTRARPGAPVAVPITWNELSPALRPDRYTLNNLRRRLSVLRADPWADFEEARRPITDSMLKNVGS